MPVAAGWAMGGGLEGYGSVENIVLAAVTLVIVLALSKVGVATISRLSILLAIVIGTVIAAIMGKVDFSGVAEGGIVALPTPFAFGTPTFQVGAIVSMLVVVLVIMTETTADIIAVAEIVDTDVTPRRIADGLRADMISSAVAPVFNSFTQSAFAQNVGLVAITGVRSRFVVTAGASSSCCSGCSPSWESSPSSAARPRRRGYRAVRLGRRCGDPHLSTVNTTAT